MGWFMNGLVHERCRTYEGVGWCSYVEMGQMESGVENMNGLVYEWVSLCAFVADMNGLVREWCRKYEWISL